MRDLILHNIDGLTVYVKKIKGKFYYSDTPIGFWEFGGNTHDEVYKKIKKVYGRINA